MVGVYHWVIEGNAPIDALAEVLDHVWEGELKDYEASQGFGHVFVHLATIANWLNGGADWHPNNYVQACRAGMGSGWRVSATRELPGSRTPPAPSYAHKTIAGSLDGKTIDVTERAKAAGFGCPVSVTVRAWRYLIANGGAFHLEGEEESLAELLRLMKEAYTGEGRDVYTWFHGADYGPGAGEVRELNVKGVHRPDPDGSQRFTVMMSWEEEP